MDATTLAHRIRLHGLEMTHISHGSHIASILSVAEIVATLYADVMKHRPNEPDWAMRDRLILSKGHAGAAIYAALAECGYFPVEELLTHYQDGSRLSGHVSHKGVPGVEFSTGSLGHGLPVATGMALAAKLDGTDRRVFVILGDGECDEGSNWEAALFAHHNKLDNLTVIIDSNKMQSLDYCENTLALSPFVDKWKSFGFDASECDGHDCAALAEALNAPPMCGQPRCVIANTIKGKGVSFMENDILWHYRYPHDDEYAAALAELEGRK